MTDTLPRIHAAEIRAALIEKREIALLDVREEDPHANGHPLFAAHLSLSRLELSAYEKLPRRDVPIVTIDDDGAIGGYAERAAKKLVELGYTQVAILAGGIYGAGGWRESGGEIFRDVNAPSKAFGELVDTTLHTPSLAAEEVLALIDAKADIVVLDVRRFDEYQTMSIPGGINVPGAELALRTPELAPDPKTRVIVNCAGRTRSIIGTQSLVNFGLPNPVAALRNGTIGWTLAGLTLEHGQTRRFLEPVSEAARQHSAQKAEALARRAGVEPASKADIQRWRAETNRTTYFIDVRDPMEYEAGHLPGFIGVPGGQLVQETEMTAPVRGARFVLADTDGVRANMTASWLRQMDWEVHVHTAAPAALTETGLWQPPRPPLPDVPQIDPATLNAWLHSPEPPVVLDFAASSQYRRGHIPGARFVLRSDLAKALVRAIPRSRRYVLTSRTGLLARFAHVDLAALLLESAAEIVTLAGGTLAWGLALTTEENLASPTIDRYRRPYEGTEASREAMQAYLDWEFGLVAQLERDGTHHFRVLEAARDEGR